VGTGSWGHPFPPVPQEKAVELVEFTLSQGFALFDTAPAYAHGLSEQWLGIGLRGVPRDRFVVSTKVGKSSDEDGQSHWDWSRDGVLRSIETSRKRLGIDQIDIVHLHDLGYSPELYQQALAEAYPTLVELREQGVIRAIGAGVNRPNVLMDLIRQAQFDCFLLANRYTLLEHAAVDLLDLCQAQSIAIFLGGIYNTGILATGAIPEARFDYHPAPPQVIERVRKIEAVCARYAVPLKTAALQFPLAHPAVKSLVIGTCNKEELADTLALQCHPVPAEFWSELRAEGLLLPEAPAPGKPMHDGKSIPLQQPVGR
jgi:D-threo-aldose 1-dehydrogenase